MAKTQTIINAIPSHQTRKSVKNLFAKFFTNEDTLSIGLTGAKKTAVTGVPEIAVWRTSALTSGTQDAVKIDWTQTANTTGYQKGIRCTISSEYSLGSSAKAIYSKIDLGTTGCSTGYVAGLATDIIPPNSSLSHGAIYGVDVQIMPGASSSWGSAGPVAFMHFGAAGTVTYLDDAAFLFVLDGVNSGATHLWYDHTDGAYDEWIKVKTPSGTRYIPLMDGQAA
jgi:hypothetical protein